MAVRYYRISPRFWADTKSWSEDARFLALYLLTSPHRTLEGLYRLPRAYICADLGWDRERLGEPFRELLANGFMAYDEDYEIVFIAKALKYQPPANPNQVKSAIAQLEELPPTPLFSLLTTAAERFAEPLAEQLRERFGNGCGTVGQTSSSISSSNSTPPNPPTQDPSEPDADTGEEEEHSQEEPPPTEHGWPERLVQGALEHEAQRALEIAIENGSEVRHPEAWKRSHVERQDTPERRKTLTDLALTAPSHYQPPDLLALEQRHHDLETQKALAAAHVEKFHHTHETETDVERELQAMWPDQTPIIDAGLTRYRQLTEEETDE